MYDWDDDDDDDEYYDDSEGDHDVPIVRVEKQHSSAQPYCPILEPGAVTVFDLKGFAQRGDAAAIGAFLDNPPAGMEPQVTEKDPTGEDDDEEIPAVLRKAAGARSVADVDLGGGWSLLMHAVAAGQTEVASLLLQRGADPNLSANDGTTPLLAACASAFANDEAASRCVQLLLEFGASVAPAVSTTSTDRDGPAIDVYSPLHAAAVRNYPQVIEALERGGCDVNGRDGMDWTPLMAAADAGNLAAVNALLNCGADPRARVRPTRASGAGDTTAANLAQLAGHVQLADALRVLSGQTAGDDRLYWVLRKLHEAEAEQERAAEAREVEGEAEPAAELNRDLLQERADELATFLYGLGLGELLPSFREQKLTLPLLMKASDAQLIEIGVKKFGDRCRILSTVQEMHKVAWKEDKPVDLQHGKPLKLRDVLSVIGHSNRHVEYLDASVCFVLNHLTSYREYYLRSLETRPNACVLTQSVSDVTRDGLKSCRDLYNNLRTLHSQILTLSEDLEVTEVPDLVLASAPPSPPEEPSFFLRCVLPFTAAGALFLIVRHRHSLLEHLHGAWDRLLTSLEASVGALSSSPFQSSQN